MSLNISKFDGNLLSQLQSTSNPIVIELVISSLSYAVMFTCIPQILDQIKLNKDFNPKKLREVYPTYQIDKQKEELDMKRIRNLPYGSIIAEFATKLTKTYPNLDLRNFYNNIKDLRVKESILVKTADSSAVYFLERNMIIVNSNLNSEYAREVLFHELVHMASSSIKNGIAYTGFLQNKNKAFNRGLNEGYTQVITDRLGCKKAENEPYWREVEIALNVEKIVGKEKMEELYFKGDLKGLVNELSQYSSEEEVIKFLMKIDFIHKHVTNDKSLPSSSKTEMLRYNYREIYKFLLQTYAKKIKKEYEEKQINKETLISNIAEYISLLNLLNSDELLKYLSKEERKDMLNEVLQDTIENEKIFTKAHKLSM